MNGKMRIKPELVKIVNIKIVSHRLVFWKQLYQVSVVANKLHNPHSKIVSASNVLKIY